MTEKRKPRLPVYEPEPSDFGDDYIDYVSMNGVKAYVTSTNGVDPQTSIVQTGRGSQRQPYDLYAVPDTTPASFEPEISLVPKGKKYCSGCGEWVKFEGFTEDKRNRDGLQSHCKSCHAAREREAYWRGSR